MPRRTVQRVDPLSAQSRTLAVTRTVNNTKINTNETNITLMDGRLTTMENSATGIVDGGRADVQHLEATDIDGGSAAI